MKPWYMQSSCWLSASSNAHCASLKWKIIKQTSSLTQTENDAHESGKNNKESSSLARTYDFLFCFIHISMRQQCSFALSSFFLSFFFYLSDYLELLKWMFVMFLMLACTMNIVHIYLNWTSRGGDERKQAKAMRTFVYTIHLVRAWDEKKKEKKKQIEAKNS